MTDKQFLARLRAYMTYEHGFAPDATARQRADAHATQIANCYTLIGMHENGTVGEPAFERAEKGELL